MILSTQCSYTNCSSSRNSERRKGSTDDAEPLLAGCKANRIPTLTARLPGDVRPFLTHTEDSAGSLTAPHRRDKTPQPVARWRRARREKKPRNSTNSIRPSCPNCCEKMTTSTVRTARLKVSQHPSVNPASGDKTAWPDAGKLAKGCEVIEGVTYV